ncbi:DDE-type integrase/transposase/recombinase [Asaia astilbis]|uniref:DDE-type integrase/transposase/recombinase n=1 Tax=Asaia astilbis TaxID=610244 RepID=UPI0012EB5556
MAAVRGKDQNGYVLDEILRTRRNAKAARRRMIRLPKQLSLPPMRTITDRLKSYGSAGRRLSLSIRHLLHKNLNNRAENSRLPLQKRECVIQKFRSPDRCQRFVSTSSALRNFIVPPASITMLLSLDFHRITAFAHRNSVYALGL